MTGPIGPVPGGLFDQLCRALAEAAQAVPSHHPLALRDEVAERIGADVRQIVAVGTGLRLQGSEYRPLLRLRLNADHGPVVIEIEMEDDRW